MLGSVETNLTIGARRFNCLENKKNITNLIKAYENYNDVNVTAAAAETPVYKNVITHL